MKLHSQEWPYLLPDTERSVIVAYALWMLWGLLGVHRGYLGKYRSGLVYLFTFGLLGCGWLYDLLTLPRQVAYCNLRINAARARREGRPAAAHPTPPRGRDAIRQALLESAVRHDGALSVTQGVLDTGLPFAKVGAALRDMQASGYVDVRNDPESGVVQYVFPELTHAARAEARTA